MEPMSGITPLTENPRKDRIIELYLILANVSATIKNQMLNGTPGALDINKKTFYGLMYELCTLSLGYDINETTKKNVSRWSETPKPDIKKTLKLFDVLILELTKISIIKR